MKKIVLDPYLYFILSSIISWYTGDSKWFLYTLGAYFILLSFGIIYVGITHDTKPKPIKNLKEHPWFNNKKNEQKENIPRTSVDPLNAEYVKELIYSRDTIYTSIKTLFAEKDMKDASKKLDHYSKTSFTKYGNHYDNIYKKYRKKSPKTTEEANKYLDSFIDEYEKAMENLGHRLIKEEQKERDKLLEDIIKKHKKFEREKEFMELSSKVGNELAKYITKYPLSPEEVGLRYEQYIGYLYEEKGCEVIYNGATKGKNDGGIDLIVKIKKKTLIVQCKNIRRKNNIHENVVNQLNTVYQKYAKKNPREEVSPMLITTHDNLDKEAMESLEIFNILHTIIPMTYKYPMIKCNINKTSGAKIYHLPIDGQYKYIKIRRKQGNFYSWNPSEAERYGFIRTQN